MKHGDAPAKRPVFGASALVAWTLAIAGMGMATQALAQQQPILPYQEYDKRIRSAEMAGALKSDLFGDSVSLYNGATDFSVVDIDVPGNNALPVQLRRRLQLQQRRMAYRPLGGFGDWDIDVPYIHGTFDSQYKWNSGSGDLTNRCSQPWYPRTVLPFRIEDIWAGNHLHLPGSGDREVLRRTDATVPSDGSSYPWSAAGFVAIRCVAASGYNGEGFEAVTTDGTTYTFDVGVERSAGAISKGSMRTRTTVYLMASQVTDRHGNWVKYNYSGGLLQSISSNDGRSITLQYSGGHISAATVNGRTWQYAYAPYGSSGVYTSRLIEVVQPDSSTWTYSYNSALDPQYVPLDIPADNRCLEHPVATDDFTLTVKHPSNAVGTFDFGLRRHRRSGTPENACVVDNPTYPQTYRLATPDYFDVYSLKKKTVSGPGLSPLVWQYSYDNVPSQRTSGLVPCLSCQQSKTNVVLEPDGSWKEFDYGVLYALNDGRLLETRTYSSAGSELESNTNQYVTESEAANMPFPDIYGTSWSGGDPSNTRIRPVKTTTVQRGPLTFTNNVTLFDEFARSVTVVKSSSQGYTRTDGATYSDDLADWILGQPATTTVNGVQESRTDYDTSARPIRQYMFGQLRQTLTYNSDGTVATVKDGRNNVTTLSSWKRGVPQAISYADGTTESAVVDNNGWITRTTNEAGFATNYGYDAMGRIASITHPTGDSTAWNVTQQTFAPAAASAYGIPAGHWRQTISTGNARTIRYFDALWRPLLVREYDTASAAATQRLTRHTYDHEGRTTFSSYPVASATSLAGITVGTTTTFDVLGRTRKIVQASELGPLTTTINYESTNGYKIATNPRGKVTRTWYKAFDVPTEDWPVAITYPGGRTDIERDAWGKARSITRSDMSGTSAVTRHYIYDSRQQLCKTVEPETLSTVLGYDAAGNLSWSASGQNYPALACESSVPSGIKITRTYDARNRVQTLTFPDGNGNQTWGYTPDGLPQQVVTYNDGGTSSVTNAYTYNRRRLLASETMTPLGQTAWSIGYQYNPNGHLASLQYPGGLVLDHAPNALGQQTRAGSYATNVSYFPNGAIKQFTYGNGIVHTLTQNTRGLPERSRDAYGSTAFHDDSMDYDQNGNVLAISDGLPGARGNRDLSYDGLDRLTAANSPMFGQASYSYDALDNLRTVSVAGRNHTYEYDSRQQLTNVRNSSGATVIGLGYDAQGNLANKNGAEFDFDLGNRLRQAVGIETYRYDAHGRRFEADHPALGSIRSMYGQDGVLRYQRDLRKGKATSYVMLGSSLVAEVQDTFAPGTPVLTVPSYSANGAYQVQWTATPSSTRYELQESTNGGTWQGSYSGTSTSRSLTGKSSAEYRYRVRACNTSDCSGWSAIHAITVELPPSSAPVVTLPSTAPNGGFTASWTVAPGSTEYVLQESANSGAWSTIYTGASLSRVFSGKAAGSYAYRVKGCNPAGCGPLSTTKSVQSIYAPSSGPSLTLASQSLTGAYVVSWAGVATAASYQLEQRVGSGSWTLLQSGTALSRSVSGAAAGQYSYRVKACNDAGCGPLSAAKTILVTLKPTAVPTLTVPAQGLNGSYSISWTSVATATTYQLQERIGSGAWTNIQNTSSRSRGFSGRAAGTYSYRVRGCNIAGCASFSAIKATTVILPPPVPSITQAHKVLMINTPGTLQTCTVRWTSATGANEYQLQAVGGSTLYTGPETSVSSGPYSAQYCAPSYVVRSCNVAGCSAWSPPRTQTVETIDYGGGDPL